MARGKRFGRNAGQRQAIPPLAPDETRVIFAQHPSVLIEQICAMTEHLTEPTHELSIVTGPPGSGSQWLAATLSPIPKAANGE